MKKLIGEFVALVPLEASHREALRAGSPDKEMSLYFPSPFYGPYFDGWFDKALAHQNKNDHIVYVVVRKLDNKVVGITRYYEIALDHRRLRIGYTWYFREVWGTAVNPESKLLLLTNAFENLNCHRVEFSADVRNVHSCAAIKKLGAVQEGILRQNYICDDGYIRDTVLFSILKPEWPAIKIKLQQRLL